MDLFNELVAIYPDLSDTDFDPIVGTILLKDDGDGIQYIDKWEHKLPIPNGFKIGK